MSTADFHIRVRENQSRLQRELRAEYDYIVCGSGSSGSVVTRRLAENPDLSVLLLEAGGSDDAASVTNPGIWFTNIGTERDWGFLAEPNPHLNGRAMPLPMGKVLGGGSSINGLIWARGHRNDWDYFAAESGDEAWNYPSVLKTYRRIEDWQGESDPIRRGSGGLLSVQPAPDPHPLAAAALTAAAHVGIPTFNDQNGVLMESDAGAAITNLTVRDGRRQSVFRSYVHPLMAGKNLTVLSHASVTRVLFDGLQATGVELEYDGKRIQVRARRETVLSLGAVHTPKVLMQSGVGDAEHLEQHGIAVVRHLPGVGQNFQDHVMVAGAIWEYEEPHEAPRNNVGEATFFWKTRADLPTPDIQTIVAEIPITTQETRARFNVPAAAFSLLPALVRPRSRGRIKLSGREASDPVRIEANTLAEPDDLSALMRGLEIAREIGNGAALRGLIKREVMPGNLDRKGLENFIRDSLSTVWHLSGTAKMGRDPMSVVDAELRVYGIKGLRIADSSIMPRVTTGNTMAPCVVIGERLAELLTDGT